LVQVPVSPFFPNLNIGRSQLPLASQKTEGVMKISVILGVCLTLAAAGTRAQSAPAAKSATAKAGLAAQSKIDPAKEADIR